MQLSPRAKVDRWFELRAESGFVDGGEDDEEQAEAAVAAAEALLKRHKRRNKRRKLSFKFGRSTF